MKVWAFKTLYHLRCASLGKYAHELFHTMGFRHEGSAESIMHGSFAQSGFKAHGVHAYHIDKLNSVYGP